MRAPRVTPEAAPSRVETSAVDTLAALGSTPDGGLATVEARRRLEQYGANELPERPSRPFRRFAGKFWGLSAWMLELIVVLSFLLHKRADVVVAFLLLVVNAVLSFFQEQRASAAVSALRHQLQVTGRVLRDGRWQTVPARELVAGDVVRLRTGDFVPADIQVLDGTLSVDQSVLTGESRPRHTRPDDTLYSGSIVRQGEATGLVVATGVGTYFGRTTQLIETARPKLHIEDVVTGLVKRLFLIVGVLVAVTVVASLLEGLPLADIVPLSLVLLMSAVPVALPVMFTVSMALGSLELGQRGVLVTRLSAAEDAANMDVLCADKTGTLTMNRLALTGILAQPGFTDDDVIRDGALASHEADQDPIDLAFLQAARDGHLLDDPPNVLTFVPFSPQTRRTEALVEAAGHTTRVMKGALLTVAAAAGVDPATLATLEANAQAQAHEGQRILAVGRADGGEPLRLVGLALLSDPVRSDSLQLIDELRSLGVNVKMLTGDALPVARQVAHQLGIGEVVDASELRAAHTETEAGAAAVAEGADGFAEVFPEDKFLVVEALQAAGHVVGMTGDGVNDAPALRQAEVGIAVSSASDVAKGAASVVLTTEGLASIVTLVTNGRAIYQRVLTWIINKVSRTILKAGYVVIAFLATGTFVISALGMVLLVFMTDFVKIALATDNVRPSPQPETWKIDPLLRVAVILGILMLIEALGLLAVGWHRFDLADDHGRLHTFAFQTLLFFALFSIISIRERRAFWASPPSTTLTIALLADAGAGLLVGLHGIAELQPLPLGQTAFIVGYAALCFLGVNDFVKRALMAWAERRDGGRRTPDPPRPGSP